MKTSKAIEVIKEYQAWLDTPPELDNTGIYVDDNFPNRVELDKALSKAVEVMEETKDMKQLLIDCGNKIQPYVDDDSGEDLLNRIDKKIEEINAK